MNKKRLYTIGYEGAEFGDFIATLQLIGIKKIIDVRDFPLSRKRGFSKTNLASSLAERGIAYVHLKALGDPKTGRDAAKRGDFVAFRRIYNEHIKGRAAQEALQQAGAEASTAMSSLLCYERAHENCHRSIVADALSKSKNFAVHHIFSRQMIAPSRKIDNGHKTSRISALG